MARPKKYHTEEERREAVRQRVSQVLQGQPRGHQRAASEGQRREAGGHEGGAEGDLGGNVKAPALLSRGTRRLARGRVTCIGSLAGRRGRDRQRAPV